MPVFRMASGECLTGREMNKRLGELSRNLEEMVPGGKVSSHSFRCGVASEMGRKGFTEEEIMQVGRWKSDSWRRYCKLPRVRRALQTRNIGCV